MKRLLLAFGCSIAWNLPIPAAIAAPANPQASSTSNAPKTPALQKTYRKAMEAYEAKRFDEATEQFQQVLKGQPDHISSKIFLARSLYQQKNISESFKIFQTIDVKLLDPASAYDFGQVAFRSNDSSAAIKAFAIVPNGHPLYDLAGFYGGISAFKLGDYQQAIDLFDQAVVLPSKLVRMQKLYHKEAEKKLIAKQRQELQGGPNPSNGSNQSTSPTPPAPVPVSFVLVPERGVLLSHRYMSQTAETKSASSSNLDLSRTTLSADWGSELPAPTAKSQWIYKVNAAAITTHNGDQEIPIQPSADQTLQYMTLTRYHSESLVRTAIEGGYETAIGERSTVGASAGAYAYIGDGDFTNKIMYTPYAAIFVQQKGEALETNLRAETHPRFDSHRLLITQSLQEGSVRFNFSKKAFLGMTGQLDEYSYNVQRLSGPDWNGRFMMQLGYHQDKSLSLSLGAFYETAQGWRLYDATPDVPLMKFNLSQTGAFAKADMMLMPWLTIGITGKIASSSYDTTEPASAEAYLDDNYGSKISQFSLYVSLIKTF